MIPATSIAFQDDGTAWLCPGPSFRAPEWQAQDRPCDTCEADRPSEAGAGAAVRRPVRRGSLMIGVKLRKRSRTMGNAVFVVIGVRDDHLLVRTADGGRRGSDRRILNTDLDKYERVEP